MENMEQEYIKREIWNRNKSHGETMTQNYIVMEHIIQEYVESHYEETITLLKELAAIPAPSGREEKRAAFVLEWLHKQGAAGAFID